MQQKTESGRSLIEIIAILVILAILLIAALVGFKALLDYLRQKQTAEEIGVVGMRYKVDRLGKKTRGGNVSLKEVYPEGNNCNNDSTCIKTPDGGEIRLFSYEDTSTFVVIAQQITPQSCAEAVLQEGYTRVKRLTSTNPTGESFFEGTQESGFKKEENFNIDGYLSVEDFKKNPERTIDFCCGGENYENTTCSFGFIYSNSVSGDECRYFINGKCSYCPDGKVKAPRGATPNSWDDGCCDENDVSCGLCGGCEGGDRLCKHSICVECENDSDCYGKEKDGVQTPYCDLRTGRCVPCKDIGQKCTPSSGVGIGPMWCLHDIGGCVECTGTPCGYDCACCEPDETRPGQWVLKDEIGQQEGDSCSKDNPDCPSCAIPMHCNDTFKCECPAQKTLAAGEKCNDSLCPDACGSGLVCLNGTCQVPPNCEEPDQAKRLFGIACTSNTICPCANEYLTCRERKCACASVPTKKDAKCWGECGCGSGLTCSTQEQKEEGKCECADLKKGDACIPQDKGGECPCGSGLDCRPDIPPHTCQCNPPEGSYQLDAGEACAGEDVCPHQCKEGLTCVNGKCGCETDADCADDCEGRTKCNTSSHVCVCDTDLGLVDGGDGKCYCKSGNVADKTKEFWRIPKNNTESKPTQYICCATGYVPYLVGGEYVCRRICGDGEKPIKNLALLLDYSNSTIFNGYETEIKSSARKIMEYVRSVDSKIDVGVFREDNSHSTTDPSNRGQVCKGANNAITIQNFGSGTPNLDQHTCAYNCDKGKTCFTEASNKVHSKCGEGNTLAFLISDGVIPNNSAKSMGCSNERTYILAANADSVDFGLGQNMHQLSFTVMRTNHAAFLKQLENIIIATMCIDPAEAETITSNWVCKSN